MEAMKQTKFSKCDFLRQCLSGLSSEDHNHPFGPLLSKSQRDPFGRGVARSAGVVETMMTEHFKKSIMKQRRRALRKNLSKAEAIMWKILSR